VLDEGGHNVNVYGGYYLNEQKQDCFIHKNNSNKGVTKLLNDNIVKTINYIQSIGYIINKEMLRYILQYISEGVLDNSIIMEYHSESPNLFKYRTNHEKKGLVCEILRHNSKCYVNRLILSNAILYENCELYFPVFIDFRGRLYTNTPSFSFQGSELVKSLLYYKKGVIINEQGLKSLKYYVANCYGIGKKSNEFKLKWVEENLKEIIDIDNKF